MMNQLFETLLNGDDKAEIEKMLGGEDAEPDKGMMDNFLSQLVTREILQEPLQDLADKVLVYVLISEFLVSRVDRG